MDFSAIKNLYIGSTPVQSAWLNGSKVWGRNPAVDEQSIRDAMILWYDLKKQGATNESMTENPVLADLSGNGHDITCYNFAWSGMSGIGGYVYNYSTFRKYPERATIEVNSTSVRVLSVASTSAFVESNVSSLPVGTTIQQHKIKVTGLDVINIPNTILSVRLGLNPSDNDVLITEDGVYDIPLHTVDGNFNYSMSINRILEECDVLIELLPLYPNALVSDGVDDYAITIDNISLNNFTLITSRVIRNKGGLIVAVQGENHNSIIFEAPAKDFTFNTYNFGVGNNVTIAEDIRISIMTPDRYNNTSINKGDISANNKLSIFRINNTDNRFSDAALYSLLLFDRTLTTEEIEWVKKNMIESGGGVEDGLDAETLGKVK